MQEALVAFAKAEAAQVRFGGYSGLSVRNLGFARQRPPRDYLVAGQTRLIDIVDMQVVRQGDTAAAAHIFSKAELPAGVERMLVDGIAIVEWSAGARRDDAAMLAERLSVRDRWLVRQKVGRPAEGWNENGDAIADPLGTRPEEGLTLYSPSLGIGYLAVHSGTSPAERKSALAAAERMRTEGKTRSGATLAELVLVADTRAAAVELRADAAKFGLKRVVYVTTSIFWIPFPRATGQSLRRRRSDPASPQSYPPPIGGASSPPRSRSSSRRGVTMPSSSSSTTEPTASSI
jgi:hypothetical protein